MSKRLIKTLSLLLVAIMLFSNVAVFADSMDILKSRLISMPVIKEYVKTGIITEINKDSFTIGEKLYKSKFKITNKTTIMAADGTKIKFSDLKKDMNVEVVYNKQSMDKKDKVNTAISIKVIKTADVKAEIKNVIIDKITVNTKNETTITINYETIDSKNKVVKNSMKLLPDKDTKIYNQNGELVKLTALKEGMTVNVEHSTKITKAAVPQAYVYKITIVKEKDETQVTESKILKHYKSNNKSYILVGEADKIGTQILFILDDKAVIKNKYNQVIAFEDLKVGLNIKVVHSKAMAKSLPPQSVAYSVQVLDELNVEFIEDAVIEEVNVSGKTVTASYEIKVGSRYQECLIVLTIDNNTKILDKNGKAITLKDLKVGMVIDVKHEFLAVLSSPPKAYAHKISVVSNQVPVDDEDCEIYNLLYKLFFELDNKAWLNCLKNHDHSWRNFDKFDAKDFFESFFDKYLEN